MADPTADEVATLRAENETLRGRLGAAEAGIAAEIAAWKRKRHLGLETVNAIRVLEIAARIVRESA